VLVCNNNDIFTAPSWYGPFTLLTRAHPAAPGVVGSYEDANLHIDARGYWHMLYHVYVLDGADATICSPGHNGSVVSGHYYSPDGFNWTSSSISPYSNQIALADGTVQQVPTRERPKVLINAQGVLTHLSNGVCAGTPQCGGGVACVDCKNYWWDNTNVSPLTTD